MNTKEAIKKLESIGFKVYPKGDKFSIWWPNQKNNDEDFRYTARKLIQLAKLKWNNNASGNRYLKKRYFDVPVIGGQSYLKKQTHRFYRRQAKKEIDSEQK